VVARSSKRDFSHAKWQTLPASPGPQATWLDYGAQMPPATKEAPYIAVYGEALLKGEGSRARVLSPTLIWNGLPLPPNATKITRKVCPLHGTSAGVVPVLYGIPSPAAPGEVIPKDAVWAGCIIAHGSPTWHCRLCDCSWGDAEAQLSH